MSKEFKKSIGKKWYVNLKDKSSILIIGFNEEHWIRYDDALPWVRVDGSYYAKDFVESITTYQEYEIKTIKKEKKEMENYNE